MPNYTDLGNSEQFAERNQWKARWIPEWKNWIVWKEGRGIWIEDGGGVVLGLAGDMVKGWGEEARMVGDKKEREALERWSLTCESKHRLESMVNLARGKMTTSVNELDKHLWKLNTKNCVIDFETGKSVKHDPKFLMTKITPVGYEKDGNVEEMCPVYLRFLSEIMRGRIDLISYVQKIFGSSMVGKILDRAFYIWAGSGRNGKSTLANVWMGVLGRDYAVKLPFSTFTKSKFDDGKGVTPDLHRLRGARLAVSSEGEENQRLAMARLKELTGKTPVSVNPKNKDQYDFVPEATYVLDTNRVPGFDGTDVAMMDRLKIIPFDLRIDEDRVDLGLEDKLMMELDGIFKWGVDGCMRWKEEGMKEMPECVKAAIELQRQENDVMGVILASGVFEGEEGGILVTKKMYDVSMKYADEAGLQKMGISNFKKRMSAIPRFVDGLQVERMDKIFGEKGGGYRNIKVAKFEVEEIEERESRPVQGKLKYRNEGDKDIFEDFL